MKLEYSRPLSWLVAIVTFLVLVLAAVRILLSGWYIDLEYRMPGFPPDPYGFSQQDRINYAHIARDYLMNDAGIRFLGDLHFPEGLMAPPESCAYMTDCTSLYNSRELKHMVDVKNVVQGALRVWYGSLALLIVLGIWAWRMDWFTDFRRGLSTGGWLTVGFVALVILLVLVAFGAFFVFFHNVFFSSGTWLFLESDTLIRLFPERFWRDIFITVGAIAAVLGLLVGLLARPRA